MLRDRDIMVLSDEIYSRIIYGGAPVSIASVDGMLEKTSHSGRVFKNLFDDRLAARLWGDAGVAGEGGGEAHGEFEFLYSELYAARGDGGAGRSTGRGGQDGGRVQAGGATRSSKD